MIIDFVLEHKALVPATLLLTAVVCVGVGYLLLRSRRYGKQVAWSLSVLSLVLVGALTLFPSLDSRASGIVCTIQADYPTLGRVELVANVALFFPLAFFATLASQRPLWVFVAASGLSAAIEAVQALVPAIGRACDTNDWLMNTIGTVAGVLLATGTTAVASRMGVSEAGDPVWHTRS